MNNVLSQLMLEASQASYDVGTSISLIRHFTLMSSVVFIEQIGVVLREKWMRVDLVSNGGKFLRRRRGKHSYVHMVR